MLATKLTPAASPPGPLAADASCGLPTTVVANRPLPVASSIAHFLVVGLLIAAAGAQVVVFAERSVARQVNAGSRIRNRVGAADERLERLGVQVHVDKHPAAPRRDAPCPAAPRGLPPRSARDLSHKSQIL